MKYPISVSIDMETILKMREKLRNNPNYRNKSHFIEKAIQELIKNG